MRPTIVVCIGGFHIDEPAQFLRVVFAVFADEFGKVLLYQVLYLWMIDVLLHSCLINGEHRRSPPYICIPSHRRRHPIAPVYRGRGGLS